MEGIDYVMCHICNQHGQKIAAHIVSVHNITIEVYLAKHSGRVISEKSSKRYSGRLIGKENWVAKSIREGKDLTDYKKKMSESVSKAIMSNEKERKRRSELMTALNAKQQSDPEFQKIVSETAKKTSARPEIQAQRAAKLKQWRDADPKRFFDLCVSKMITAWQSKPEKKLFEFVKSLERFNFERNQFVKSISFTSITNKRQIDMCDKEKRIYIEFDGPMHFKDCFGGDSFANTKIRDAEVEKWMLEKDFLMVRISLDQYVDRNKIEKSFFKPECLDKLVEILNENKPGVYKIGEKYGKHKVSKRDR